jgi:hypothetical protein
MLEDSGALATWAIAELPTLWAGVRERTAQQHPDCAAISARDCVAAERLADHRAAYLEYEGPVSEGRGQVVRVAEGSYELLARDDESWEIAVADGSLPGRIVLRRVASGDGRAWVLSCCDF